MIVRRFISFLYSTKLMAILFIAFAIAMVVGTFVENDYDTDTARIWVYNTWWFEAIMGLFVLNFIGNISRYRLLKRENWAVLVLHLSWVFIIVGAGVTRYFGDSKELPCAKRNKKRCFFLHIPLIIISGRPTLKANLLVLPINHLNA